MKKFILFLLLVLLVACSKEEEPTSLNQYKVEYEMTLSGVYYTGTSYTIETDEYAYVYTVSHLLDNEEIHTETFTIYIDDDVYMYYAENGEWIYSEEYATGFSFNFAAYRELDLSWFEENPEREENAFLEPYELKSLDEYKDDIADLIFYDGYFDALPEGYWGNYECYISVNDNNEITLVYYGSFPSFQLEFVEFDESVPLPSSIKDELNLE